MNEDGKTKVYSMDGGGIGCAVIFLGLFCLGFLPYVALSLYQENGWSTPSLIGIPAIAFVSLAGLFYCIHLFRVRKSRVEITADGISRTDEGREPVFINWDEIGRLWERRQMQQLALADRGGQKRVLIDYQFSDYDQIRKKIFDEYEKRLVVPALPAVYGKLVYGLNSSLGILLGCFWLVWARVWFYMSNVFLWGTILVLGTSLLVLYYFLLEYAFIHRMTIDEKAITLQTLTKTFVLSRAEVDEVQWRYLSNQSGNQYSLVELVLKGKPPHFLTKRLGSLPEIYLVLKKILGESV